MSMYQMNDHDLEHVAPVTFAGENILERQDLQRLLRDSVDVIVPGGLVIAEEYSDWDSKRRIDLLCVDEHANLVVVELKRGQTGGLMELQAIRYAAMVSQMTFRRAVNAYERYLSARGIERDAGQDILDHLGWEQPDEERFGQEVRIVLVAAGFSTELTTAVLWLNERAMDIQCVRLVPYVLGNNRYVHVDRVIPLPEAETYQVRMQEKSTGVRVSRQENKEFSGYWFVNIGEGDGPENTRSWSDCRRYGFVSAGGKVGRQLRRLSVGDRVFAYRNGHGYVGAGVVTHTRTPWEKFHSPSEKRLLVELPLECLREVNVSNPDREHCVGISWVRTVELDEAIKADARLAIACQIYGDDIPRTLLDRFEITEAEWE